LFFDIYEFLSKLYHVTPEKALQQYLQSLDNDTTRTNYAIILKEFCQHFERLIDIDAKAVLAFKATLIDKSPQTISSRMSAIRSFLMYCWEHNWIPVDPSIPIKQDNVQRYQNSKNITIEQFKEILAHINVTSLAGLRDYLLLRLLFIYGDINKILDLKINSPLPEVINEDRKKYVSMLAETVPLGDLKAGYLFFGLEKINPSQKLSLSGIRKIFKKYSALAGMPENFLDFTAIKRLRAKQIYEQTNSVEAVRLFCGHGHSTQTKTFLKTLFPGQKYF